MLVTRDSRDWSFFPQVLAQKRIEMIGPCVDGSM